MTKDTTFQDLAVIVLAAGKGKRMKSDLPKVLHQVNGKTMIEHVLEAVSSLGASQVIVVLGHGRELVIERLSDILGDLSLGFAFQGEQLGTGHATLCAQDKLEGFEGSCLVTCGDTPFFTQNTLKSLICAHNEANAHVSVLTTVMAKPTGYGRILRASAADQSHDTHDAIVGIVEEKDATGAQKAINEVNTGVYCVKCPLLFDLLKEVKAENAQLEYYLTDIVGLACAQGLNVRGFNLASPGEAMGINSREDLEQAEKNH